MTERICYEFEGFLLDPTKRRLVYHGDQVSLRPTAFNLLVTLVEQHGKTVSKSELIEKVWGSVSGDDRRLHVTVHEVRRKLGDSAKKSRFIASEPNGYRFVADVRLVVSGKSESNHNRDSISQQDQFPDSDGITAEIHKVQEAGLQLKSDSIQSREDFGETRLSERQIQPPTHTAHILLSSLLYASLFAVAVILEIAYEFDRFKYEAVKFATVAFVWILFTSAAALVLDQRLTERAKRSAPVWSTAIILIGALMLYLASLRFLPATSITKLNFQSYPAQAAYLKDVVYFIVLGAFYMGFLFHDVVKRNLYERKQVTQLSQKHDLTNPTVIFWGLTGLLVVLAIASLVMTARLLDNLVLGPYSNLFTQLVYLRGVLYFGLGIECLVWYRKVVRRNQFVG